MLLARASHEAERDAFLRVVRRLAVLVATLIVRLGIGAVPNLPPLVVTLTGNVVTGIVILTIALAISAALTWLEVLYARRPRAASRPTCKGSGTTATARRGTASGRSTSIPR